MGSLSLPISESIAIGGDAFSITNTAASGAALHGSGAIAVHAETPLPLGLGLLVENTNRGIAAMALANSNQSGVGLFGYNRGSGAGVAGGSAIGDGVQGHTSKSSGRGVYGENSSGGTAILGFSGAHETFDPVSPAGVVGVCENRLGTAVVAIGKGAYRGIYAIGDQIGIEVEAKGYGIQASCDPKHGWAGVFYGDVFVSGDLKKLGGGFKIDHPAHPATKYLNHSFVESQERKNIYDGVVTLNAKGEAHVRLPKWFESLNTEFRYQLCPIGAPMPNLHIAQPISRNRFKIGGGEPQTRVSWQVTGVRNDPWSQTHPLVVEEAKPKREKGYYLQPELYQESEEKSIRSATRSEQTRTIDEEIKRKRFRRNGPDRSEILKRTLKAIEK